ncbi:hypothetical protein [Nocardia brasiliensis]|uniref:hypothetical protein n=1 Tax=Nocardia brasiliensis TaxID=37326 RepID=UPI003D92754F
MEIVNTFASPCGDRMAFVRPGSAFGHLGQPVEMGADDVFGVAEDIDREYDDATKRLVAVER